MHRGPRSLGLRNEGSSEHPGQLANKHARNTSVQERGELLMKVANTIAGSTGMALSVAATAVLVLALQSPARGETFGSDASLSGLLNVYLPSLEDRMNPSLTADIDSVNGAAESVVRERRERQLAESDLAPIGSDFRVDASGMGLFQVTQAITPLLLPDMGEMRFAGVQPMVGPAVGGWSEPLYRSK
jgi:hypothetical protein